MSEAWKPVPDHPGYEVSSTGAVFSHLSGRRLSLRTSNSGYFYVQLSRRSHFVHRLVAAAFLPDWCAQLQVNHKDGVRKNNEPSNLEMVTRSQNLLHAANVLGKFVRPISQYSLGGELVKTWPRADDAVAAGFNGACISECCHGTQLTHKGFAWRHADSAPPGPHKKARNHAIKPVERLGLDGRVAARYEAASDAIADGFTAGGISNVVNGRQRHHRGWLWRLAL